jgi:hypothetical protein
MISLKPRAMWIWTQMYFIKNKSWKKKKRELIYIFGWFFYDCLIWLFPYAFLIYYKDSIIFFSSYSPIKTKALFSMDQNIVLNSWYLMQEAPGAIWILGLKIKCCSWKFVGEHIWLFFQCIMGPCVASSNVKNMNKKEEEVSNLCAWTVGRRPGIMAVSIWKTKQFRSCSWSRESCCKGTSLFNLLLINSSIQNQ